MPIFLALARGCTAFVAPRSLLRQLPKRQQQQQQQQQQAHQDWRAVARRRGVRMMGGYASDEPTPAGSSDDSDASSPTSDGPILNRYSGKLTQPKKQGASQAMLYATGLKPEDLCKAQVGIGSVWFEGNPCNMHLLDIGAAAKAAVQARDMVGLRFNSIGVSDGISNGTDGMAYSLQSRDLIADGIETVMGAQFYDANLSIPGCDKNMPGTIMAMGRFNRPSVMIYGGTIRAGCRPGKSEKLDIISAFQAYGEFVTGKIDDETRRSVVREACPGPGACGGMYTANTMASAIEALGWPAEVAITGSLQAHHGLITGSSRPHCGVISGSLQAHHGLITG